MIRLHRHSNRAERTIVRLLLRGLAALVLLVAVIVIGYQLFQAWQGKRLLGNAERYLQTGDLKSASILARHLLETNPLNPDACRILAQASERIGQPAAVDWRMKVLAAVPNSTDDAIALARTALQFNQPATAEAALAKVNAGAQASPLYHEAMAQLALAKKDLGAAEKHFADAARLDPTNKSYQFSLATTQLQSKSTEVRSTAAALLRQLMEDKTVRVPAARALRDYAAEQKEVPAVLEVAQLLHTYPEATFADQISYVHILHELDHPDFSAALTDLQNEALTDSSKLTDLLSWMSSHRLALLAVHMIRQLPDEIANKRPVPLAVANCYIAANDWEGLQQWCTDKDWRDLEFLRHAYLARALRERGDDLGSASQWNTALRGAGSDGERLLALEQGASEWSWKRESEDLLWMLSKDSQKRIPALGALYQYYADKGDTAGLYRVVTRLCEIKTDDEKAQNNLAQLSLLLNANLDRAHQVAERLYRKDPKNSNFAATYAFSLYRKGRYPQAAKVMSELQPSELNEPGTAAYYGLFLAAAGEKAKAEGYLDIGSKARLLPEEKALLQSAREKPTSDRP